MSLITDPYLRTIYEEAKSVYEHAPMSFWTYFFNAHFPEKWFLYDREKPASEELDPARRVDAQLRYFEAGMKAIRVLCFHEAKKPNVPDSKMELVEGQAIEACATYCHNTHFTHVYAFTTIGTEARAWKYWREPGRVECLTDSMGTGVREAYIDVDSQEASKLLAALKHMKDYPPSRYAATAQSNVPATSLINPSQAVPSQYVLKSSPASQPLQNQSSAGSSPQWVWSAEHGRYYRWNADRKTVEWAEKASSA
ncbi:hypothetical protein K469DRAFT_650693 [Zopfia rhizophila CBS 207.26]|uniref:Uncharacterized protein n=1 Tax=Zopfia rhizophila CBS 207.26 TaxID=1314779 RepID=A0A6A6ET55_9PEZI|nr:hypothetical protein K469DRAFT_650693 [Zopfia rhizophila CBS 207.26]